MTVKFVLQTMIMVLMC